MNERACFPECRCGGAGAVERGPSGATYSYPCYPWDCRVPGCRCKRGRERMWRDPTWPDGFYWDDAEGRPVWRGNARDSELAPVKHFRWRAETAEALLRSIVDAERIDRLPGEHAVYVALLAVDQHLHELGHQQTRPPVRAKAKRGGSATGRRLSGTRQARRRSPIPSRR